MTPEEAKYKARLSRFRASRHRLDAAREDLNASGYEAAAAMIRFGEVVKASEAREVAEHPDLAELNVQLDGYYGEPPR